MHIQKKFCPIVCPGDPSKKLNPELVKDDYERLKIPSRDFAAS